MMRVAWPPLPQLPLRLFTWLVVLALLVYSQGCRCCRPARGQDVRIYSGGARLVPVHSLPQQGCVLQPGTGRKCCPPNCRCPDTCRCGCKEFSGSPSAGAIFREPETPQPRLDNTPIPSRPATPLAGQPPEDPRIARLEAEVRELRALIAKIPAGPPGPTGAMGPMGLPGKAATIDYDQLSAAVIERLPPLYVQIVDPSGQPITDAVPARLGELLELTLFPTIIESDPSSGK